MTKKRIIVACLIVLTLIGVLVAVYVVRREQPSDDVRKTVSAVGRHYLLPDEDPVIATVEDKDKVKSEFLRAAENGDKLLVYSEAKKVILYRPSVDRIIEVGPVSIAPAEGVTPTEE